LKISFMEESFCLYNKLVRDKIPEIIESNGKKYSTKILSDEEYIAELKDKSFEE
jgi:predicted house-cleaning noncanonical NTP pyrophosphatase (MazG superfamily)